MTKLSKPYFALEEPLSDTHIFTILGRAVPIEQTSRPLGTVICPPLPPHSQISQRNAAEAPTPQPQAPSQAPNLHQGQHEEGSFYESPSQRPAGLTCNTDASFQPEMLDNESAVTQVEVSPSQQNKYELGFDLRELNGVDLYPEKAVECRNIEYLKKRAAGTKASVAVDKMLSMYTDFDRGSEQKIAAQGFRRIEVETPHTKVHQMLEDKRYAEPVIAFLKRQRNQEAAIVVSILTVSSMEQQRTEYRERRSGLKAQVPGPMEGNPAPTPKVGLIGEASRTIHEELTGSYVGEVIVAIRYLTLKLDPPVQKTLWYKLNYMLRKWTNKLPNQNEEIHVSEDFLERSEKLRLSSKEIPGTAPALLGDNPVRRLTWRDTPRPMSEEDLNFTIVA